MAVLVMLNNYMHDLATAVFAVSALAAYFLLQSPSARTAPDAIRPVIEGLVKVGTISLVWTLAGGVVRALAYKRYEWMEAVGKAQVPALVLKHVILVFFVILGVVMLRRVRQLQSSEEPEGAAS
jgi:hypothetical protein